MISASHEESATQFCLREPHTSGAFCQKITHQIFTVPGTAREGPSVEITVRHTWPGAARQGPSVEITVTLPLHHVAPLSTSPCSAVYHPAVYPPMPRCLPPHTPIPYTPCPAAYHPMPRCLPCLPPHAPLPTTPRPATYHPTPRCLSPHAPLPTTPCPAA